MQGHDAAIRQLSDIARRQKARLAALQEQRRKLEQRAALHRPEELARLQADLARLHHLVGELTVFKVGRLVSSFACCLALLTEG